MKYFHLDHNTCKAAICQNHMYELKHNINQGSSATFDWHVNTIVYLVGAPLNLLRRSCVCEMLIRTNIILPGYLELPRRRFRSISPPRFGAAHTRPPRRNVQTSSAPHSLHTTPAATGRVCAVQLYHWICHVLRKNTSWGRTETYWSSFIDFVDGELDFCMIYTYFSVALADDLSGPMVRTISAGCRAPGRTNLEGNFLK